MCPRFDCGPEFMKNDSVQIRFDSPEELAREFKMNIVNGGIFVATEGSFEVREWIDVGIVLGYLEETTPALTLRGEIVHIIPVEMTTSGAVPGVAVHFEASAADLRDAFEPLLGEMQELTRDHDDEADKRRGSKRAAVRVPVRIMPTMSPPFESTSRDLSATGILLTLKESPLPVGEIVRTCLWHPSGDPSVEIDGKVVREVHNKSGHIAAVAVAFDRNQAAEPRVREVIDALRQAGHRGRLGGINGAIADLGLANMLQMFSGTAAQGTLIVERDGEQGWMAFTNGNFLGAELGALTGHDALVAMLDWGDGRFQFEAVADPKLIENAEPCPLPGAVLRAVCTLDEMDRLDDVGEDDGEDAQESKGKSMIELLATTTFTVDLEQQGITSGSLDKTQEAVLELAKSGMAMGRLASIIPESASDIRLAVDKLIEMGVLIACSDD